ncbi:MAG: hypothetical protein HY451_01025 [Parcubacteria group bacterium]|nr:hypothetical protein [Parcubacteria group bacterium]
MSDDSNEPKSAGKPAEKKVILVSLAFPSVLPPGGTIIKEHLDEIVCCELDKLKEVIESVKPESVKVESKVLKIFAFDGLIPGNRRLVRQTAESARAELVFTNDRNLPEQLKNFFEKLRPAQILKTEPPSDPNSVSIEELREFVIQNSDLDFIGTGDLWRHANELAWQAKIRKMKLNPRSIHAVLIALRKKLRGKTSY